MGRLESEPPGVSVEASPRYDISRDEAHFLCKEFLDGQEVPPARYSSYIIPGSSRFSNLGRAVEGIVFNEEFHNAPEEMNEEYGSYDPASTFFVAIDHAAKMPIGMMRVIENSPAGLKSFVDLPRISLNTTQEEVCEAYGIDLDRCVDISTLAILKEYRGPNADPTPRLLVYRPLFLEVISNPKFDHLTTIIDEEAQRNMWAFRFPLQRVFDAKGFYYLGSENSYFMHSQLSTFRPQLTYWARHFQAAGEMTTSARKASWLRALVEDRGTPLDSLVQTVKEETKA